MVEDGEELLATFLGSNQNSGVKPSIYLNRLQTLLTKAISRGRVSAEESDKHLLRQFCRGGWDQSLLVGLQLEHRKNNPPSFPELLLLLRIEEDRQAAKINQMKKHLGSTRTATYAHLVSGMPVFDEESAVMTSKKRDASFKLEKEVAELRKQVAQLMEKERKDSKLEETSSTRKEAPLRGNNLAADIPNLYSTQTMVLL